MGCDKKDPVRNSLQKTEAQIINLKSLDATLLKTKLNLKINQQSLLHHDKFVKCHACYVVAHTPTKIE